MKSKHVVGSRELKYTGESMFLKMSVGRNVLYQVGVNINRCPWCDCYRRRKWTRRHEFKSWTRLVAFHIAPIPLGKV